MEPTTEPRTDIIVAMIDLLFNGISVITNLIVAELPALFEQFFNFLFGLLPQ